MQVCDKLHSKIVHEDGACPLCNIIKHNNLVHDFIEQELPEIIGQLCTYLHNKDQYAFFNNVNKYTISKDVYAEWIRIKNMINAEKTFLSYICRKIDEEEENEAAGD